MGLLTPLALLFGLLAVPIIALYLLRLRRRDRRVSSTFLWQQVLRDLEANVPWQRLRPNLLLFLQMLVLAALVLALARPYLPRSSAVQGDLFLLLDASASMQAMDVAPSRFDAAKEHARELVGQLPPGNAASIILMGEVPELLVAQSADRDVLREAINSAHPLSGGADLTAALSLAASLVQEGRPAQAVVLSDGNLEVPGPSTSLGTGALGPLPMEVRHQRVGATGENLAVAAFSTRRTSDGLEALARVANYGASPARVNLHLTLDGALYDVRPLDLPPGGEAVERWVGLPEAAVLETRLDRGDAFPLDDRAWALGGPTGQVQALLITDGNRFLERALALHPALEVTTAAPDGFSQEGDYDLWVFDGFLPPTLPEGPLLVVDPPAAGAPWVGPSSGPVTGLRQWDDSLTRYVDLSSMHLLEATPLQPPPDARLLVSAAEGPLLAVWQEPERRIAAVAFDLHESDLPLQPSFPILVQNLTDWLLSGLGQGLVVRPGQTVEVPLSPEAQAAWVEPPGGERVQLAPPWPPRPFTVDGPGLYRVVQQASDRELETFLAANLFSPEESALEPALLPDVEARASAASGEARFPWELAPWLALAALAFLGLEWWVYNRGR